MSSSEEYLDSLLDSILGGNQSGNEPKDEDSQAVSGEPRVNAEAGKAMSTAEIEEMLVSMGTLGNEADGTADDLSLDNLSLDDLSSEELPVQEEVTEEDGAAEADDLSLDDLSLDDLSLDDLSMNDVSIDDLSLDNLSLDDLSSEELPVQEEVTEEDGAAEADDLSLDDLSLDDLSLDDLSMNDVSIDDLSLDNLSLDDLSSEELPVQEEVTEEDGAAEADDLSLDDLSLEESGEGEPENGIEMEEPETDNDDRLDDLVLEEHMMDEMEAPDEEVSADDADGLMSEEDIDRLLSGEVDGELGGDFALEETGEGEESDDDLSALLAGMDHDEELSEINDLLETSDQGVSADDDMLAMLEGTDGENSDPFDFFESDEAAKEAESIRELTPEEIAAREGGGEKPKKEKKKRKKLFGKKKKGGDEAEEESEESTGMELEDLLSTGEEEAEIPAEEKKPGLVARILNFLLESDEEDEDPLATEVLADNAGETGNVTDENKELLAELNEEDKKGKKKKKKDKKGKKGKGGEGEEGAEGAEGEEGAEDKKALKKKKKKEKKEKKAEIDLLAPPEKKLSKKKVITVFLFCATMAACIVLVSTFLPNYLQKREAHVAYDHGNYDEVFSLLYDKKRGEQDEILFQRSNLVLQMERKLDSYDNYVKLDMRLEALNALISGVSRYQKLLPEAEKYNVVGEVSDSYAQILERLSADFGVSEEQALEIIASEDDVTYSQRLEAIISGAIYGEDVPAGRQDVLPEEEEIIERIEGLE